MIKIIATRGSRGQGRQATSCLFPTFLACAHVDAHAHLDAVTELREDDRPRALAPGLVSREVLAQHLLKLDLTGRSLRCVRACMLFIHHAYTCSTIYPRGMSEDNYVPITHTYMCSIVSTRHEKKKKKKKANITAVAVAAAEQTANRQAGNNKTCPQTCVVRVCAW